MCESRRRNAGTATESTPWHNSKGKALSGTLKSDSGHHGIAVQELLRELDL